MAQGPTERTTPHGEIMGTLPTSVRETKWPVYLPTSLGLHRRRGMLVKQQTPHCRPTACVVAARNESPVGLEE